MRRNRKDIAGTTAMILRKRDGMRLSGIFHADVLLEDNQCDHSSSEVRFVSLIEGYMAKHRLTIATAHGRFLMRKWMKPKQMRSHAMGPVVRLPIPEPPATM